MKIISKLALKMANIINMFLKKNVDYNKMLFNDGSATYLEIITAQQSLLNAELSKVQDDFYKMQAVVNLYYALGGGRY